MLSLLLMISKATSRQAAMTEHTMKETCPVVARVPITAVAAAGECGMRIHNVMPMVRPPAMTAAQSEWLTSPAQTPTAAAIEWPPMTLRGWDSGDRGAEATSAIDAAIGGMRRRWPDTSPRSARLPNATILARLIIASLVAEGLLGAREDQSGTAGREPAVDWTPVVTGI